MSTESTRDVLRTELRTQLRGDLIEPGSPEYELESRTPLVFDSPAAIVRPANTADVQAAVRFAVETGLQLSVRGGGHSFAGFGTNDGGVVIELSRLADVALVDEERHIVRVGGGATWGQVGTALAPWGLSISAGDTTSVGVGGLTLGGGIGWKVRKHGLALDNLVAAELVTADGEVVRAAEDEHPELFWALRGGGGNFGLVTAFEFAAHPATEVFHGTISFPAGEASAVLAGWADHLRAAPDELTSTVDFANPFTGGPDAPVEVHVAFDGDDAEDAARAIDPIRALGTVIADDVTRKAATELLVPGGMLPPGLSIRTRSGFVQRGSVDDVLRMLAEVGSRPGSPAISIRSVSGAVSRIPAAATAYAHRTAELMFVTTIVGPQPVVAAAGPSLDAIWDGLEPYVAGAYVNFLSAASEQDVASVYPQETYDRLAAVKATYDPENVFSSTLNVLPISEREFAGGR
ncbi:FAD-binding oxidoreductase [Planctomonas sp. JC2975]|uniref:FAD-binding oxidoreductase n=1 Tax=Planctomonas sp. JC2975 TaxID=2729626 RepID=UPI0014761AE0|nr:FAD-binding oxidoreductase [Planctomonas sp. JC2975]NNC12356.1 FAD-binding oxidoreductase [Planctomonas sp. JC2975]